MRRPHWRAARTWPPDETLQHTLYLAEPAVHVEDAVNSIKVARNRRSPGPEDRHQVWLCLFAQPLVIVYFGLVRCFATLSLLPPPRCLTRLCSRAFSPSY